MGSRRLGTSESALGSKKGRQGRPFLIPNIVDSLTRCWVGPTREHQLGWQATLSRIDDVLYQRSLGSTCSVNSVKEPWLSGAHSK